MSNEMVIEMVEAENNSQENVVETKTKFRDKAKAWWERNKKKVLIGAGVVLAAGGMTAAKAIKDHKNAAEAKVQRDEVDELAENWFQNSLLEAHESSGNEPAVDVEITPAENE